MTGFFLNVAAVVVGVAVFGFLRKAIKRISRWRRTFRPSMDPWDNW